MIEGKKVNIAESAKIGKNTIIKGEEIFIEDDAAIGDNTIVSAGQIHIGFKSRIEENCKILLTGENSRFSVGDNCIIGHDSKIILPVFETGDYVTLNNHLLVTGYKPCTIGHNVWIGQNAILNATDALTIGNGVGIGTYNSVWTHGAHGELLEGCTIFKVAPVVIEDDAWIVGSYNIISPGVTLGKKSVVLTGSVVTKNVAPFACVAGNPAKVISDKVVPYKDVTLDEKYEMMKTFMKQFMNISYGSLATESENGWRVKEGENAFEVLFLPETDDISMKQDGLTRIIFTKRNATAGSYSKTTIFDLSKKTYTKKRTEIEIKIIKFLLYPKARFVPVT